MFKNSVRNAMLVIFGVLAVIIGIAALIGRSFRIIIPLLIVIFIFARIGSRSSEEDKKAEKKQTSNTVDAEYREVKNDPAQTEKEEYVEGTGYKQDLKHVRAISSALFSICNMDVRNLGNSVNRIAKDIIRENYEEKNGCRGFAQFERYYLPTLRKTVENYSNMERKGIVSLKIREDMISYLKSCEEAFSRMYNSMFEDDILNMEVQMEAMNIALKRDGLL